MITEHQHLVNYSLYEFNDRFCRELSKCIENLVNSKLYEHCFIIFYLLCLLSSDTFFYLTVIY